MSKFTHNETEDDNMVMKDDKRVTKDDNRDDCFPSSVSLYPNQHDYNATKTIDQDIPFDKETYKSMTKKNAKHLFINKYGFCYLIYDFEKCKGGCLNG